MTPVQIRHNFTYHAPTPEQISTYETLRQQGKILALFINELCPPSREASLALTNVEQAIFWANAAIARSLPHPPENTQAQREGNLASG